MPGGRATRRSPDRPASAILLFLGGEPCVHGRLHVSRDLGGLGVAEAHALEAGVEDVEDARIEDAVEDVGGLRDCVLVSGHLRDDGLDRAGDALEGRDVSARLEADLLDLGGIEVLDELDGGLLLRGAGGQGVVDAVADARDTGDDAGVLLAGDGREVDDVEGASLIRGDMRAVLEDLSVI